MNLPTTPLWRSRPVSAAVLLAALAGTPLAHAQTASAPAPAAHQPHRGGMLSDRTLQAIGATTDQRTKIQAIMAQAHADLRQQHQATGDLHQQLAQTLAAASIDTAAAEGLRQKILAQQDASGQRMLQARLSVAAVLTADQRQQLLALEQEQRSRWQGQHRGPRPQGSAPMS